ncbi:phenylacetate--CoA ligase family protein [Algibacter sp. AS12]|uniref:phenylacetate--CoA ligase family protein n=1 Tax=Algibacter sp. AS12 TaxID=3135773 RepID=UPI00398B358E
MGQLQDKLYNKAPNYIQNVLVSVYNIMAYRGRNSGKYHEFLKLYKANKNLSLKELQAIQSEKYTAFINYAITNSNYYKQAFSKIESPEKIENIHLLPIVNKELIRQNINDIYTIKKSEGSVAKTGGTTGKSLEVIYVLEDSRERHAILDYFRHNFGYRLGKKTAWFSGKNLLNQRDISKNRFWKTDYIYKVRYYSTFHIHSKYLKYYIENLIKFKPEYFVGFPSTMYEIAKYGVQHNIEFPSGIIKAIFPTAETITTEIRTVLESYFKTKVYNQYASSEGSPFIIECVQGNLHLELQSGVFEVLDDNDNPTTNGRLVVTPFNTRGTPLIRYDIGDQIELDKPTAVCNCGNNNPLVKHILGRISDYIYSEEKGKVNLGNISNCLKGVKGVIRFQIQQDQLNALVVLIEKDDNAFTKQDEQVFLKNLKDRVGEQITITLKFIDNIPVENSGKYRLIKNNIKAKIVEN